MFVLASTLISTLDPITRGLKLIATLDPFHDFLSISTLDPITRGLKLLINLAEVECNNRSAHLTRLLGD